MCGRGPTSSNTEVQCSAQLGGVWEQFCTSSPVPSRSAGSSSSQPEPDPTPSSRLPKQYVSRLNHLALVSIERLENLLKFSIARRIPRSLQNIFTWEIHNLGESPWMFFFSRKIAAILFQKYLEEKQTALNEDENNAHQKMQGICVPLPSGMLWKGPGEGGEGCPPGRMCAACSR